MRSLLLYCRRTRIARTIWSGRDMAPMAMRQDIQAGSSRKFPSRVLASRSRFTRLPCTPAALILTPLEAGPSIIPFAPRDLEKGTSHGSPEAANLTCTPGQAAESSAHQAHPDPVLRPMRESRAAAPRLLELRLLPGARSARDGKSKIADVPSRFSLSRPGFPGSGDGPPVGRIAAGRQATL